MEIETLDWLRTSEGERLLAHASQAWADHPGDPVRVASVVRRLEPDAEKAAAATTQAQLRARAATKFGDAARLMFFTPDALEQATRTRVADHRAARLAAAIPGGSVVDLGCGIGGDLLAFARAGLVAAGIDQDPVRVAMAEANLAALGLAGAVMVGDATAIDTAGSTRPSPIPARRGGRGRVFDVEGWTPPWAWVLDLLTGRALVKVAPGHRARPGAARRRGRVGQRRRRGQGGRALVAGPGDRRPPGDRDRRGRPGHPDRRGRPRRRGPRGRAFLYEPDGAVIRAGLVTAVAAGVGGGLVDEHIAYVTGDDAFRTPFARGYRVVEHLPYREKQLRAALHERGIGRLTIKKRGVQVVPDELRKRLALKGDEEGTLVLTRVAGQGTALLVEPF